jgi:hypothetical protein
VNPSPANLDSQSLTAIGEAKEPEKTKTRFGDERKRVLALLHIAFSFSQNHVFGCWQKRSQLRLKTQSLLR